MEVPKGSLLVDSGDPTGCWKSNPGFPREGQCSPRCADAAAPSSLSLEPVLAEHHWESLGFPEHFLGASPGKLLKGAVNSGPCP